MTKIQNNRTSRFAGASWFEEVQNQTILLAGIGGVGSWTAMLLSRLNPKNIILIDFDTVEDTNFSGQFFTTSNLYQYKTLGTVKNIFDFSNYNNVNTIEDYYTESSITTDIMICGFDNMSTRKVFYNNWKNHVSKSEHPERCLFIDGRLSAEICQVLSITGANKSKMEEYEKTYLFSDEEAIKEICSYKQTSHCAALIAGFIVNSFVNFITNLSEPSRSLPFFIEYNSKHFNFK